MLAHAQNRVETSAPKFTNMGAEYSAVIQGKDANFEVDHMPAGADITGEGIDF